MIECNRLYLSLSLSLSYFCIHLFFIYTDTDPEIPFHVPNEFPWSWPIFGQVRELTAGPEVSKAQWKSLGGVGVSKVRFVEETRCTIAQESQVIGLGIVFQE